VLGAPAQEQDEQEQQQQEEEELADEDATREGEHEDDQDERNEHSGLRSFVDGAEPLYRRCDSRNEATENKIAAQLSEWRTERIGIPAKPESDRFVAMKLTDWLDPPGMPDFPPIDLTR
jgi:hypothetical protein